MQPKRLADHASNAIALDGIASRLYRNGQPQTRPAFLIDVRRDAEEAVPEAPPVCINRVEFALPAQAPLLGVSQPLPLGRNEYQVRELKE